MAFPLSREARVPDVPPVHLSPMLSSYPVVVALFLPSILAPIRLAFPPSLRMLLLRAGLDRPGGTLWLE